MNKKNKRSRSWNLVVLYSVRWKTGRLLAIKDEYKYLLSSQQKLMGKALFVANTEIYPTMRSYGKKKT